MFIRIALILMSAVPMFALSALGYLAFYRFDEWKMRRFIPKRPPEDTATQCRIIELEPAHSIFERSQGHGRHAVTELR